MPSYKRKKKKRIKTRKRKCVKKNKSKRIDPGYVDKWRGWYDVQKCGRCYDYCRWVGDSGRGGNPRKRTQKKKKGKKRSWWSCWLGNGKRTFSSNKRWKKSFKYNRCSKEGNLSHGDYDFIRKAWTFG